MAVIDLFLRDTDIMFATNTQNGYRSNLRAFFKACSKNYDMVEEKDISEWIKKKMEEGLKPGSVNSFLIALKSFYNYLIEEDLVQKNPTTDVKKPKTPVSPSVYLDKLTLAKLRELTNKNLLERAVIETLYCTGVRISELTNILQTDIDWENRQIWIRKGKGLKERYVLFSTECDERLHKYLKQRKVASDYLFVRDSGKPCDSRWAQRNFRKYSAQLNTGYRITPHMMRHTFAAHLAEKGAPLIMIQDLLGHKDLKTTKIYTKLDAKARKSQYDRYK